MTFLRSTLTTIVMLSPGFLLTGGAQEGAVLKVAVQAGQNTANVLAANLRSPTSAKLTPRELFYAAEPSPAIVGMPKEEGSSRQDENDPTRLHPTRPSLGCCSGLKSCKLQNRCLGI
jgi:hypothetical protein